MGSIYSDWGLSRNKVGECDDGYIYKGWGIDRERIGEYSDDSIYSDWGLSRNKVGEYDNGYIYKGWGIDRERIGEYQDGRIYKGWGIEREQVGEYEGNHAGAAAFLLLDFNSSSSGGTSGGDSNDGCLSTLFYGIGVAIGALFRYVIFPVLKVYFLAFWLSSVAQMTWVTFAMILLCTTIFSFAGVIAFYIVAIPAGILHISFFPYWAILMWQKIKKQMTWKEVCSYYWKWFLKGPFAYLELARILNNNNSMPKVANLLDKIIGWFKKVFKKK